MEEVKEKKQKTWEECVPWTPEVLRDWLENNKRNGETVSLGWLSKTCGKGGSYLTRCIERRRISPSVLKKLVTLADISYDKFTEFDGKATIKAIEKRDFKNMINESKVSWREFHGPNKEVDLTGYDLTEEEKKIFAQVEQAPPVVSWEETELTSMPNTRFVKLTKIVRIKNTEVPDDMEEREHVLYLREDRILSVEQLLKGSLVTTMDGSYTVKELPADIINLVDSTKKVS